MVECHSHMESAAAFRDVSRHEEAPDVPASQTQDLLQTYMHHVVALCEKTTLQRSRLEILDNKLGIRELAGREFNG